MDAWLADALTSAKELARRRGQALSTAHLLVALSCSDPSASLVCAHFGLRDVALVAELMFVDERTTAIDVVLERAKKLATAMGMHRMLPLHLLHALAHERHCAANRMLFRLGVAPAQLSQAALDRLEAGSVSHPSAAEVSDLLEPELAPRQHTSMRQKSRVYIAAVEAQRERARANGLWLGEEVEQRLPRRSRAHDRPQPTFADAVEAKLRRKR
ncbi:MAG TPA: hypothetical protein VJR89_27315 [Polyangiales bacterium]|nr:hypothetical protein [Polyangiales bacterium]